MDFESFLSTSGLNDDLASGLLASPSERVRPTASSASPRSPIAPVLPAHGRKLGEPGSASAGTGTPRHKPGTAQPTANELKAALAAKKASLVKSTAALNAGGASDEVGETHARRDVFKHAQGGMITGAKIGQANRFAKGLAKKPAGAASTTTGTSATTETTIPSVSPAAIAAKKKEASATPRKEPQDDEEPDAIESQKPDLEADAAQGEESEEEEKNPDHEVAHEDEQEDEVAQGEEPQKEEKKREVAKRPAACGPENEEACPEVSYESKKFNEQRLAYIGKQKTNLASKHGDLSKKEIHTKACLLWTESDVRARLIAGLSTAERKRRRF
jgi:hypothetical protein